MSETASNHPYRHLFWIGGSPCGGKSTVAEIIAEEYGLHVYHVDQQIDRLMMELTAKEQPALSQWAAQSWDERWMQPAENLLSTVNQAYDETFYWCLPEILAIPPTQPTIIEGNPLRPALVTPHLADHHHAIWLIATDQDLKRFYSQRDWAHSILQECAEPELAFHHWMDRDIRFARQVEQSCLANQLPFLLSDARQTLNEKARKVAEHFCLVRAL